MDENLKNLLIVALIGIVAGFLASQIVPGGGGLLRYLISGVLGAFVGTYLFKMLGVNLGINEPIMSSIVTSTIGAIVVLVLARLLG
jgi:uncharacterized membrane protein YeaQ/YmgE (transglycosylase-associated protein family)